MATFSVGFLGCKLSYGDAQAQQGRWRSKIARRADVTGEGIGAA